MLRGSPWPARRVSEHRVLAQKVEQALHDRVVVELSDGDPRCLGRVIPRLQGTVGVEDRDTEVKDDVVGVAVVREVAEETGVDVVVDELLGWVERFHDDTHYVILDFRVTVLDPPGALHAGDDAAEAEWVPLIELGERRVVDGLLDFLGNAGVLAG